MDNQERLYALALSLVPDVDVAGDMFMDARDEADLERRAARWRRQQGLPELAAPAVLPALSAEQREYAYHLARRGRRRRQMRPLSGLTAVAMIAMLVILVGFRGLVAAERGLPDDPAYRAQPVAASTGGALQFTVYKVEATPGSVTFWWAMTGRNAVKEAAGVQLSLEYYRLPTHATLVSHETAPVRDDRLVGRTSFRTPLPLTTMAGLSASRGGGKPEWQVAVQVDPEPDPSARTVPVGRSVLGLSGQVKVTVVSVTVAADYTVIRYRPEGEDFQIALAAHMEVEADGKLVERYGTWRRYGDSEEREVLYGPLPAGATRLTLQFPRLGETSTDQTEITVNLPR
ncbi:MAG TPA: hypothetical protein VNT01_10120 [Symbiobacteriaceae bacterium]|nr:hypothetical protein [Symbiobacteriaceae bacterium]